MPDNENKNNGNDTHIPAENPEPKPFRLGEYSNDPDVAAREDRERQASVVKRMGDYLLTQHPIWPNKYTASRADGNPIPRSLAGLWQLSAFEQALRREKGRVQDDS